MSFSKRTPIRLLAGATAAGGALLSLGGLVFSLYITGGKRQTLAEAKAWQASHYDISWFEALDTETYTIQSEDGYVLHVELCKNPSPVPGRYVILTHGYTDNRYGMLKYMQLYLKRGYHCIIWDLRGHGENEKAPCSYSIREGRDLYALILDTYQRYGQDISLGLHGESLGSATTAASLGLQQRVAFAVLDCGFSDIMNVLDGVASYRHQPAILMKAASVMTRLRCGFSLADARPVDALAQNRVPLLFLHGEEDKFILPENSLRMHQATRGYSEFHLIPKATHANAVLTDPVRYEQILSDFLDIL